MNNIILCGKIDILTIIFTHLVSLIFGFLVGLSFLKGKK